MKKIVFILSFLLIIATGFAIYFYLNVHKIDEKLYGNLGGGMLPVKYDRIDEIDNLLLIKQKRDEMDDFFNKLMPPTREMPLLSVKTLHSEYKKTIKTTNYSRMVIFDLKDIISAMKLEFGTVSSDWDTPSFWENRGFIVYFGNYGASPNASIVPDNDNDYSFRNTAIIKLCKRNTSTSDWSLTNNGKYFDFGDVHPPKAGVGGDEIPW